MGKYGEAAVEAANLVRNGREVSPVEAWWTAVGRLFPVSPSSRDKGCPKGTFLGLCEAGLVAGVAPGQYTSSQKNKRYGLRAVVLLRQNPELADDEAGLWRAVMAGEPKASNSQMDVVTSLWRHGLINRS